MPNAKVYKKVCMKEYQNKKQRKSWNDLSILVYINLLPSMIGWESYNHIPLPIPLPIPILPQHRAEYNPSIIQVYLTVHNILFSRKRIYSSDLCLISKTLPPLSVFPTIERMSPLISWIFTLKIYYAIVLLFFLWL